MFNKIAATVIALVVFMSLDAHAEGPLAVVEARVDQFVKILGDKTLGEDEKVKAIEKTANETFDFFYLSRMTLGPNWKKLDNSQQGEFIELYRQLLQGVYFRQLLTYTDEKIVFVRETMLTDTKAEVASTLISSSKQIPINYRLVFRNGEWRVYDLVIEGVSLVSNYRNQFNDLLNKKSPADMLMTLRKKVTEEKNQT